MTVIFSAPMLNAIEAWTDEAGSASAVVRWTVTTSFTLALRAGCLRSELLIDIIDRRDAGRVAVGPDTDYDVRRLDDEVSAVVARKVFQADLEEERAGRT